MSCPETPQRSASFLLHLFLIFLKIGTFTIGGGHVMIPLIQKELVHKKCWMDEQTFFDDLSLAQAYPGSILLNFAITSGYSLYGFPGIAAAVSGGIIPSFLVILLIAALLGQLQQAALFQAAFAGIRPAVAALIAATLYKIGVPYLKNRKYSLGFFFLLLGLGIFFRVHALLIILLGISAGFLLPEAT